MGADRAERCAAGDGSIASLSGDRKREMLACLGTVASCFHLLRFGIGCARAAHPGRSPPNRDRPELLRDSLTVLAILLIGVLTAALVGPYFVDWDSHRAFIERKLSEAAGTPVTVSGPIDLKILPKPLLRFGGVTVGNGAEGRPRLTAEALDAELSLAALMRGQVQLVDTTLVRPRLALVQARDGGFGLTLPSDAAADRVTFDHLGLRDGTLDLTLADGRHATVTGIDLDGGSTSLRGPFKVAGRIGAVPFHLGTGAIEGGRLRIKLGFDALGSRPSLDLDGTVAARPGGLGPGFDGTASLAGQVPLDGTTATVPWRATARITADRDGAKASEAELRAGTDLRALIASGQGSAAYAAGASPARASLHLKGAVLDVDSLAVAPTGSAIAPPQGLDLVRRLLRGVGDGARLVSLPMRLDLGAAFDTATLAGRTVLGTTATLGLGPEPSAALTFAVDGPEGAHLGLDGRIEPGPPAPVEGPFGAAPTPSSALFRGRAEFRANDLRHTAAWIRPAAPELADWLAASVPARAIAASARLDASGTGIVARDLDLHIDGSAFAGTLSFNRTVGSERARLFADLSSDALALDRLPDLTGAAAMSRDLDLDLALSARAVTLAASSAGPIALGRVALRATKNGADSRLDKLALDLVGGHLDATGSRDLRGARGELHLSAPQLGPIADAMAPLLPVPVAAALRTRAPALSPVDATLTVAAEAGNDGALAPTALALAGTAGGTRIDATLAPDGPAEDRDAERRRVAVSLSADAPAGADLFRLLGFTPPGTVVGAGRAKGSAKGTWADGFTGTLEASLGETAITYAGRAGTGGGAGHLTLHSPDLRSMMTSLGVPAGAAAVPAEASGDLAWDAAAARWGGLSARVAGSNVTGTLSADLAPGRAANGEPRPVLQGRLAVDRLPAAALFALMLGPAPTAVAGQAWASQPFAPPPNGLPRGELALTVADLPLRDDRDAHDVALTLRTAPNSLAAEDIAGSLETGGFGGTLALRRDGPAATLSGRLSWHDVALNVDGLAGRIGGTEEIAASGTSPAALSASLAGIGTLTLSGATLARTDPGAPARVLVAVTARDAAAERGSTASTPTPLDLDALRRDTAAALDAGPLPIGSVDTPAILTGGVLRVGPVRRTGTTAPPRPGQDGPVDWTAEASFALDLNNFALTSRVDLRTAPGGAEVVASRTGPFGGEPARDLDVTGLAAAIQAAAIARAQDRVSVMEQDIRERATFNRQLKAAMQRQQAEREAAAAARAAAAGEAQKAAEERRAEAERQRAEDARLQAQVDAAARAEAAREEAEKQRFFDRAPKGMDPSAAPGTASPRPSGPAAVQPSRARDRDIPDPPPPPSIIRE